MTNENVHNLRDQLNNVEVIKALRTDRNSHYWGLCTEYIQDVIENRFPYLSPQAQEDATQEAVLLVYHKISTFRGDSKFTTWITTVTCNHTIDILRKQKGPPEREVYQYDQLENYSDEVRTLITKIIKTPEEIVQRQELLQEIFSAFEEFTQKQRKYERNKQILPQLFRGYTYKEIAEELGVSSAVVSSVFYSFCDYMRQKRTYSSD